MTAAAFAAKYKSKRECYTFLAVDVQAYLPAYDTITIYFLKDIINGSKKSKLYTFYDFMLVSFSDQERPHAAPHDSTV